MAVEGVGRVEVTPDTLVVSLGVESPGATATAALEAMSQAANRMLDAIRDAGVPEEEIKTVSLRVHEVRQPRPPFPGPEGSTIAVTPATPQSFIGEQPLRVRILDLESAGAVIERAVQAAGADARVFDMSLEIEDPEEAITQARRQAIEDALARGEQLAEAAGIDLGGPISIDEVRAPELPAFDLFSPGGIEQAGGLDAATATAGAAPQIQPGTSRVGVRVQVRFAIEK